MTANARFVAVVAAFTFSASPALAENWRQMNGWFWIDLDSVRWNGRIVTFVQAHGRELNVSPAVTGPGSTDHIGFDCDSQIAYWVPPGETRPRPQMISDDWDEEFDGPMPPDRPLYTDPTDPDFRLFCG